MRNVTSWGRLSALPHQVIELNDPRQILGQLATSAPGIAYGMGRSYGDACLNPEGVIWQTRGLDHFISFDNASGLLRCEAGVLLRDIQRLVVPHRWILPVTPGTQLVTLGGAIANDVHGKNHHALGTFGDHVRRIVLARTDGTVIECGPTLHPEWFAATLGGVGLTGVIVEADIQLRRIPGPWLDTETLCYSNLDEFFSLSDDSESAWEHTVSWIDCTGSSEGRGLFMRGNFAPHQELPEFRIRRPKTLHMVPPVSLVNGITLRPFNSLYFNLKKYQATQQVTHYETFFYPLDNLLEWNRMYGPNGFFQYQSVVPRDAGSTAIREMLNEIRKSGEGSFLAVLKTFGKRQSVGMLSFPQPGVTLALDFPNRGARTLKLFDRLDAIVQEAGGRIYLAKDARMPRALFKTGYPRLSDFLHFRDPGISSGLSRRLMGS